MEHKMGWQNISLRELSQGTIASYFYNIPEKFCLQK